MAPTKYHFSHRAGGRYYWTRRAPEYGPPYEEQISCNVGWFWGWYSTDDTLPHCDCKKAGSWGATGMMPPGHCLVVIRRDNKIVQQYLAHKVAQ